MGGTQKLFEIFLKSLHPNRDALTIPFDIEDSENAVRGAQNNKSPGLDGLSYEFYKETFHLVGSHLLD